MPENTAIISPPMDGAALRAAMPADGTTAYLGDSAAVEALWRNAVNDFVARWSAVHNGATQAAASRADIAQAQKLGGILFGADPKWQPISDFNARILPKHVTRYFGITDDSPRAILEAWAADFLSDLHETMDAMGAGKLSRDDAHASHESLIEDHMNVTLGLPRNLE